MVTLKNARPVVIISNRCLCASSVIAHAMYAVLVSLQLSTALVLLQPIACNKPISPKKKRSRAPHNHFSFQEKMIGVLCTYDSPHDSGCCCTLCLVLLQKLAERRRPRKANVYEQLHKDAGITSQKIQQKRQQRDQDTLKVIRTIINV